MDNNKTGLSSDDLTSIIIQEDSVVMQCGVHTYAVELPLFT